MKRATKNTTASGENTQISIHALVKRATGCDTAIDKENEISIHALVKRATEVAVDGIAGHDISIHALVKRATKDEFISSDYKSNFNPRPREEGDTAILGDS